MVWPTTHLGYTVWSIAPWLQACKACYCKKQHESKSSTRANDALRCGKQEMYEAAAGITQRTVIQLSFFFNK